MIRSARLRRYLRTDGRRPPSTKGRASRYADSAKNRNGANVNSVVSGPNTDP
jgi:hypothetical protein